LRGIAETPANNPTNCAGAGQNGTLKTYKGFPHGMPTTEAATINADLLAFIKG
jgi:non-heme chloroperoxidase